MQRGRRGGRWSRGAFGNPAASSPGAGGTLAADTERAHELADLVNERPERLQRWP